MLRNHEFYSEGRYAPASSAATFQRSETIKAEREPNFFEVFFMCFVTTLLFLGMFALLF